MNRPTTFPRVCAAAVCALLMLPARAPAQELEPGAYWPIPTGFNIVTIANSFNFGDLAFDPSAPIDEASARINTTALAFTRAFNLAGRSANVGVIVPIVGGHIEGLYLGEPAEVTRFGQADFAAAAGSEPLRRAGDDATGLCQVSTAHDCGVQLHGRAAARPIRLVEADQHRQQPLVVQAGGGDLAAPLAGGSSRGWRASGSSPTTTTFSAAGCASRIRSSRRSST